MAGTTLPHFIEPGSEAANILEGIIEVANAVSLSEDFSGGYAGEDHPYDVDEANSNLLLQFDTPGGGKMEGAANPSKGGNIGSSIHTLMMLLSPFITGYSLLMPIIGIILGILEVICALMNPFALIPAVVRLFKKWVVAFISIMPPSGGVVLLKSVISLLLALVYWIMTEVVPTIQLIVDNIANLIRAFENIDDLFEAKIDTAEFKLRNVLKTLIQKLGIMKVFKPVLELLFLILRLFMGFPCSDDNSDRGLGFDAEEGSDSSCCDYRCPEILSDRSKVPEGYGIMLPAYFGDCMPLFVFQILTINPDVLLLEPYQESLQEQMLCQMDEAIKYAMPPGSTTTSRSLIKIIISDANEGPFKFSAPVLDINGPFIKIGSPLALIFNGQMVHYKFEIDYEMMVMQSIIGTGCHPDVKLVKDNLAAKFRLPAVTVANPEAEGVLSGYTETLSGLTDLFNGAFAVVDGMAEEGKAILATGESPPEPPFLDKITYFNNMQNSAIEILNDYQETLVDALDGIVNRNMDRSFSLLDVNKKVAIADAKDYVIVTVTPKNITNVVITKALPTNVIPRVEILSTFGEISNQTFNNSTGTITAELRSSSIGNAEITAKVNGELVTDFDPEVTPSETLRTREVRFVGDAILPTRRKKTKQSKGKVVTTKTSS